MATPPDPKKAAEDIEDSFANLRKTLQSISEELGINVNKITEAKKEYRGLLDVARQLQNNEEEITKLSDKQIKSLRSRAESNLRDLKATAQKLAQEKGIVDISKANLKFRRDLTEEQFSLLSALKDNFSVETQIVDELEKEDKLRKKINQKTGILGGLLKGISKIPVLGDVFDAEEALDASKKSIRESNSALKGLNAAFGNLGKQIIKGVLNPANLVLSAFTLIVDSVMSVDTAAGDFAKSMNISYGEALKTREELDAVAKASGDTALTGIKLQESLAAVNDALGTSGELSEKDLKTFTKLREQAGMTNEEIMGMYKLTLATGGTLENNVVAFQAAAKSVGYQNKIALNTKKLMADMANVSNRTKVSIQGGAKGLAEAAAAAKLMGGNLDKVANIADSILDFESSIENELSAQLLTGKNINLEQARQYAINNDMKGLAEEITEQAGSLEEYQNMNRIQQEAMAKAVGMTADELADVLVEQEAIRSVGDSLNEEQQKAFEAAKEKYGLEKASEMLKKDGIDALVDQQSQQERLNDSLDKMKTMFSDLAPSILGILQPLTEIATVVLPAISYILEPIKLAFQGIAGLISGNIEDLSTTQIVLGGIAAAVTGIVSIYKIWNALTTVQKGLKKAALAQTMAEQGVSKSAAIISIIKGAWSSVGILPVVGAGLAVAAIAGGIALLNSSSKVNDGVFPAAGGSGHGKRMLLGPEGAIQLNNKDTVIAGTNLFDKADDMVSAPAGAVKVSPSSGGNAEVVNAINNLKQSVAALASRPVNVSIDGQKVIKATTGANPNTDGDEMRKNSYKLQ